VSADFLTAMAQGSRERVLRARELCPEATLRAQASATPAPPRWLRSDRGFDLIAEVKLRSPALGRLRGPAGNGSRVEVSDGQQGAGALLAIEAEISARVRGYARAGAAIVSVLTEPRRFDGSLSHLEWAAQALAGQAPVMRKDFLVDPYQVYEARAAGAGGVLLILRMLAPSEQAALIEASAAMGMFALLEAFDAADLERAAELIARYRGDAELLVGVNCRDLGTLKIVPERLESLAARLPRDVARVAESGIESAIDAERVARAGYTLALVGSALMRSEAPEQLARAMLAAGRAAVPRGVPGAACR
jgi:indole-3-glycerol phosphate synthase